MKKIISILVVLTLCLAFAAPVLAAEEDYYLRNAAMNADGSITNTASDGRISYIKDELDDAWTFSAVIDTPISGSGSTVDLTIMLNPDATAGVSTQVQFKVWSRDDSAGKMAMAQIWYQGAKAAVDGAWTQ